MTEGSASKNSLTFLAVVATLVGLIPTVYATYISNSLALFSDFLRCLAEFLAVLFSWLVLQRVQRIDRTLYNYGFGKFELIASLVVALAMFISFTVLLFMAYERLSNPVPLENSMFGYIVSSVAVLANTVFWLHYKQQNAVLDSPVIESQWKLFRAKTVASLVVVVSLSLSYLFSSGPLSQFSDPLGSILVACFLLYSAYSIVSSSMGDLVDRALEESFQLQIMKVLVEHESLYRGFRWIRSRRSGAHAYIQVCLEFDGQSQMAEIQKTIDILEAELQMVIQNSDITIIATAH